LQIEPTSAGFCAGWRQGSSNDHLEDAGNWLVGRFAWSKKAAASQVMSPFTGQLEASIALPRFNRCWPLRTFQNFCGRPFLGVSFRTFTARSNAEKGTPAAQLFDNRSIA